jgi:radical SAM-linked protein
MLTRADRRMGAAIATVADRMTGLQSWDEGFDYALWEESVRAAGSSPDELCGARPLDEPFPYEYVDMGVTREFLLAEREKAYRGEETPDCALGGACVACGVCDHRAVAPVIAPRPDPEPTVTPAPKAGERDTEEFNRGNATPWLFSFAKRGRALSIGHLDLVEFFLKGFTRERLAILYSEGFHPTPRFSLLDPLPVGVEAEGERGVLWLTAPYDGDDLTRRLNALFAGSGIVFHEFVPYDREALKETLRRLREIPVTIYACRFSTADDLRRFRELHPALDADAEGTTLYLRHPTAAGSIMKLFADFTGDYHIIRKKRS